MQALRLSGRVIFGPSSLKPKGIQWQSIIPSFVVHASPTPLSPAEAVVVQPVPQALPALPVVSVRPEQLGQG